MRVTMLVWCSAMLLAAPVFAGVDCHNCCSEHRQTELRLQVQPSTCPHCPAHVVEGVAACHSEPSTDDDCGTQCPRCQRSRPAPYDRTANTLTEILPDWQMLWLPAGISSLVDLAPPADRLSFVAIVPDACTICVLFQRWLN